MIDFSLLQTHEEKTADYADAPSARSSSLFCLRQNLLRSRFGAAGKSDCEVILSGMDYPS